MREKIYEMLNKTYGVIMMVAFFAGIIPLIPFIIAIIIGGSTGEAIALFLDETVYPWIIVLASIAIIIGLIAMYVKKEKAFTVEDGKKYTEKSSLNEKN